MAKSATKTASGRTITSGSKPAHLGSRGGPGKSRQPTEFDDMIPAWYEECKEDPALYKHIPAQGDTDEEKLADLDQVFKDVAKAAQHHNLGVDRLLENDPSKEGFESYALHVRVRDRQARGPKPGSLKDPNTGKLVAPDDETGRYQELVDMKDAGEI